MEGVVVILILVLLIRWLYLREKFKEMEQRLDELAAAVRYPATAPASPDNSRGNLSLTVGAPNEASFRAPTVREGWPQAKRSDPHRQKRPPISEPHQEQHENHQALHRHTERELDLRRVLVFAKNPGAPGPRTRQGERGAEEDGKQRH